MPGTLIRERTARIPRSLPTDTGVYFLAGMSDRGATTDAAVLLQSTADFETRFGGRTTYSLAWDMVDAFFNEGGSKMYFSRVFGPNPVTAGVTLNDDGAVAALRITATSPGAWANTRRAAVIAGDAGGEFKLVFTDTVDTGYIETSPSFVDQAAAIAYYATHKDYRVATVASANDPAIVAATTFTTAGTDDRANATDATWLAALTLMTKDLGPGQVGYAARTTAIAHGQLLDHAKTNNRAALLDPPDGTTDTGFLSAASADRALVNAKYGAMFAPWVNLPALSFGGTLRPIPASAAVAGVIARNDGRGMSPNDPAGGERGILQYADSLRAILTKVQTDALNEGSVNMIIMKNGDMRIYGYRSIPSKNSQPLWWQFGNLRLYMAIAAKADNILERFVLRKIDGQGKIFGELNGQLSGMLEPYYTDGSLFGEEMGDAFFVDTGPQVNTSSPNGGTIAAGEIHAVIELTMSPMGETVILDIVRRAVGS